MATDSVQGMADRIQGYRLLAEAKQEDQEVEGLDELIKQILSENAKERQRAIKILGRTVTDNSDKNFDKLLNSQAMKILVDSIGDESPSHLQFESAWTLTNLLAGGSKSVEAVVRSQAVEPLVKLLKSPDGRLQEQASWAIANIVGESAAYRDVVIHLGLLPALEKLWDTDPGFSVLDPASLILVNLFRDQEPAVPFQICYELLPRIKGLLDHRYQDMVPNLVWAISYMIEDSEERIRFALEQGVIDRLRQFLDCSDPSLLVPTLRAYGNISCKMDLPDSVVADQLFRRMRELLEHGDSKIRRQVLFFISNATDGPDEHLDAMMEAELPRKIGEILSGDDEHERREGFWVVPNFCISRTPKYKNLVIRDCLNGFLDMLQLKDAEMTHCILLTVRSLLFAARYRCKEEMNFDELKRKLENNGGLKKIEMVQQADNADLASMSHEIIDHFFCGNEHKYMIDDSDISSDLRHPVAPHAAMEDANRLESQTGESARDQVGDFKVGSDQQVKTEKLE